MILKCNCCGRTDELSPLRIGRRHANCFAGGKWIEDGVAAAADAKATVKVAPKRRKEPRK